MDGMCYNEFYKLRIVSSAVELILKYKRKNTMV
jgi:hypothetical protein